MSKILCAAIWFNDGKEHEHQPRNIVKGFVVCGHRHHNVLQIAHILAGTELYQEFKTKFGIEGREVQGFLTDNNLFLNRQEAAEVALREGQITKPTDTLFSEDLY